MSFRLQPNEETVALLGKYSWELLLDIDNTDNAGYLRRKEEVKSSIVVNYNNLLQTIQKTSLETFRDFDAGTPIELISIAVSPNLDNAIADIYKNSPEMKSESREEKSKTTEIEVGPHSTLKLYRLVFKGPGISYETETLSSTPHEMEDVIITANIRKLHFLKGFHVVYTQDKVSKPEESVQEVHGLNADINEGFGGDFVWLLPIWTTRLSEGASGIELIIQSEENKDYQDLAKGTGGEFRYLKMIRDASSRKRITEIKLFRTTNESLKPSDLGYPNYSEDINKNRRGDFLYLCWRVGK